MDAYQESIARDYPCGAVGEEFFEQRIKMLRNSLGECDRLIELRVSASRSVISEIGKDRARKRRRLQQLPMAYSAERTALMKSMDELGRERRCERIGLVRDLAQFQRERREKREEYEMLAQQFRLVAFRNLFGERRDHDGA